MTKYTEEYQKKVGLSPGTLVHIGAERTDKSTIAFCAYDETSFEEKEVKSIEDCFPLSDKPGVNWFNIDGVHQTDLVEDVGKQFCIHPLVLADIVNTRHRPKMEDFEDYLFIVLKMISYDEKNEEVIAEQISLIVGLNYVISFQESTNDLFLPIKNRIKSGLGRIRKMGADYLAYALIDTIVDNYFVVLERTGEKIEDIEEKLLKSPSQETIQEIYNLKRNMIFLRRSVWPLREVASVLERGESKLIHKATRIYLRDVYDHTVQVIDTIETSRDTLSGMLDIYLSSVSNKMNEVMKVLTIIATIFMPLTFIAGLYGMNFKNMPELDWRWAEPMALVLMIASVVLPLWWVRRKGWL